MSQIYKNFQEAAEKDVSVNFCLQEDLSDYYSEVEPKEVISVETTTIFQEKKKPDFISVDPFTTFLGPHMKKYKKFRQKPLILSEIRNFLTKNPIKCFKFNYSLDKEV